MKVAEKINRQVLSSISFFFLKIVSFMR